MSAALDEPVEPRDCGAQVGAVAKGDDTDQHRREASEVLVGRDFVHDAHVRSELLQPVADVISVADVSDCRHLGQREVKAQHAKLGRFVQREVADMRIAAAAFGEGRRAVDARGESREPRRFDQRREGEVTARLIHGPALDRAKGHRRLGGECRSERLGPAKTPEKGGRARSKDLRRKDHWRLLEITSKRNLAPTDPRCDLDMRTIAAERIETIGELTGRRHVAGQGDGDRREAGLKWLSFIGAAGNAGPGGDLFGKRRRGLMEGQ